MEFGDAVSERRVVGVVVSMVELMDRMMLSIRTEEGAIENIVLMIKGGSRWK